MQQYKTIGRTSSCGVVSRSLFVIATVVAPLIDAALVIGVTAFPNAASAQTAATPPTPFDLEPAPVNQPPTSPSDAAPAGAPLIPSGVAVGRTKGSYSVTSTGASQYVIPLWTPRGIADLTPALALTTRVRLEMASPVV